ncbi:MAG: hypothetical protein NC432_10245 [Roseburia sp.]|nr:hypothetical protein [Roseburia sp.]MCM1097276.1 hypothetical protein [Ruminococcus flavefaciens]
MGVSVCVGNYARTPYCIPGLELRVYCMEELCYCMKENAFLLDSSIMEDSLPDWIGRECGLRDLAKALYPLIHKKGSFSAYVMTLFRYTGFYDRYELSEVEQALKKGAGLSGIEKRKSQTDYLVGKKKYAAAIRGYDHLIERWQEQTREGEPLPAVGFLASVWHNRGVALAGLMTYSRAAESFRQAWEIDPREDFYRNYLAAKRMELSESDYIAFAAAGADHYEAALALERDVEQLIREWEETPEYLRLYNRREFTDGEGRQRYFEENEEMTRRLKDEYRRCVTD